MADLSTPELGKLVERLRAVAAGSDRPYAASVAGEAADALSRIAAERDSLLAMNNALADQVQRGLDGLDEEYNRNWAREGGLEIANGQLKARAEASERERDELKAEVEMHRAGKITDAQGIAWFESAFGVPLGDMPGRMDVEAMRARLRTPEESP